MGIFLLLSFFDHDSQEYYTTAFVKFLSIEICLLFYWITVMFYSEEDIRSKKIFPSYSVKGSNNKFTIISASQITCQRQLW